MSGNQVNKQNEEDDLPNINFLFRTMLARDPSKRRVKPTAQADLLPLALESESEDSDFRIEDNAASDGSSSGGSSSDSGSDSLSEGEDEQEITDVTPPFNGLPAEPQPIQVAQALQPPVASAAVRCKMTDFQLPEGIAPMRVCCICLGTHSSDANEVVECDSCGILVHEGCYGVTESGSVSSTASSCSTEPWFCEPCQADMSNPPCQLCPNLGGALKETDTGLWVHLVCALYIPGIAFGEVDKLTQVTLFEMPYNRWGAKSCALCSDPWLSRTGVCIGCDAGMCRTFFHVTCAQREGFLSETFHEDAAQADPFYANCKLHTEKSTMKRRKSNYLSHQRHLQWWTERRSAGRDLLASGNRDDVSLRRILRKLGRQRLKFQTKHWPRASWVPTQKMPRLLTTSASAVRRLAQKAVLMGVDVELEEMRESQANALADVPRKWHLQPAFSVEFIAYVIDRERRIAQFRQQMGPIKEESLHLDSTEKELRLRYDDLIQEQSLLRERQANLQSQLAALHQILASIGSSMPPASVAKKSGGLFHLPSSIQSPTQPRGHTHPTFAQTRNHSGHQDSPLPIHASSPPGKIKRLSRPRDSVDSSVSTPGDHSNQSSQDFWVADIQAGPSQRSSMGLSTGGGAWSVGQATVGDGTAGIPGGNGLGASALGSPVVSPRMVLKRVIRQHHHHKDSSANQFNHNEHSLPNYQHPQPQPLPQQQPQHSQQHSQQHFQNLQKPQLPHHPHHHYKKRKKDKADRLIHQPREVEVGGNGLAESAAGAANRSTDAATEVPKFRIKIKPVLPKATTGQSGFPFVFANSDSDHSQPVASPYRADDYGNAYGATPSDAGRNSHQILVCSTCAQVGLKSNTVSCDECLKVFHFGCLDPPVKKTPKQRGYSWHCADCDSSDSD